MALLVSKLALVDALRAPTAELRAQHRYKVLVVDTSLDYPNSSSEGAGHGESGNRRVEGASGAGLTGPGILAADAERGRGLRDTRYTKQCTRLRN